MRPSVARPCTCSWQRGIGSLKPYVYKELDRLTALGFLMRRPAVPRRSWNEGPDHRAIGSK